MVKAKAAGKRKEEAQEDKVLSTILLFFVGITYLSWLFFFFRYAFVVVVLQHQVVCLCWKIRAGGMREILSHLYSSCGIAQSKA